MPAEVARTQPTTPGDARARGNRVSKLSESDRRTVEATGARVVESDYGLLVLEVVDDRGAPIQIVTFDAETESGIEVIGVAFLDAAEIEAVKADGQSASIFGPRPVSAHRNGTNHSHYPGAPFHTCSYVYNWANGDSTFHMCAVDVTLLQYVATVWGGAVVGLFVPVLAYVAGLIIFSSINYYKNNDGSIDMFGPAASINNHYGNTYYWGSRGGWYYHYPAGSTYFRWARRASNSVLYRTN